MIAGPDNAEAAAKRLALQKGSQAYLEAHHRVKIAEQRFKLSLAKTAKELDVLDHWVAVAKLLEQGETGGLNGSAPAAAASASASAQQ